MYRMPFGKYRDQIPAGYLRWILANCTRIDPWLKHAIRAALEDSGEDFDDFDEPPRPRRPAAPEVSLDAVLRRWHGELTMKWYPDRGGTVEAMQAVNNAHDRLRELLNEVSR